MLPLSFYAAFLGTIISIVGWSYLAWKKHDTDQPVSLSHLFVVNQRTLIFSRTILWVCISLFAITLYLFIIPRIHHSIYVFIAWTFAFISEALLGFFPAEGKTEKLHSALAALMGFSFLVLAILFPISLSRSYSILEYGFSATMIFLGLLSIVYYRSRFIL